MAPAEPMIESGPSHCVLLLGASGLIGSAVLARLCTDRYVVRAIARRAGQAQDGVEWRVLDLKALVEPADWAPHLKNIYAVVNCAGLLQGGDDMRAVHADSVRALYAACEAAGVRRVVHVSAIGVERGALSEFSATKRAGEEALMATTLDWVVLRPSVVVGRAAYGGSALFRGLAALPVVLELPDAGPSLSRRSRRCCSPARPRASRSTWPGPSGWSRRWSSKRFATGCACRRRRGGGCRAGSRRAVTVSATLCAP